MSWRGLGRNVDDGQVVVSEFNKLEGNRYYDVESQTSFEVDHITQVGFHIDIVSAYMLTAG